MEIKAGREGSTYLSFLHLRNITEQLSCARHFEKGRQGTCSYGTYFFLGRKARHK